MGIKVYEESFITQQEKPYQKVGGELNKNGKLNYTDVVVRSHSTCSMSMFLFYNIQSCHLRNAKA